MGNSTTSLQSVLDFIATQGIPSPLSQPSGYGTELGLTLANDVMADLISERFNWKWNSNVAAPFYTNTWQQDYPQIGLVDLDWLEDADRIDINNTSTPLPLRNMTVRRQLSRTNYSTGPVNQLCWMYNKDMSYGVWPGAGIVYAPLVGTNPSAQNPPMAILDANGNILVLTTFGTTGSAAPELPANSAEGATVDDGSCVWTVAGPMSQGFRVFPLPPATGPVWQVTPKYQAIPPLFTTLAQLLNPIPDNYARYFRRGYGAYCLGSSPNPADRAKFVQERMNWLREMDDAKKQGDREVDAYGMLPDSSVVDHYYPWLRNPQDPSQPY